MAGQEENSGLRAMIAALVERRIEESLGHVEAALAQWRRGESDALTPHLESLRHVARAGVLSARVARAERDGPRPLLRDAFDLGLVDREAFQRLAGCPPEEVAPPPSLDEEAQSAAGVPRPAKRTVVDTMLKDGPVLVHLDPRRGGVDVPAAFHADPRLVLRIGHRLTPPITDLEIDEDGVRATLSFRAVPHHCVIPWSAVFAVVGEDGQGLVFAEDVPPEVAAEMQSEPGATEPNQPAAPEPKKRPSHLKLVQ
ncbi:MAG TPA: ClpXP protease specificity-enhancing factor SspB [Polyangia bacterium]|jgi:stringent starvation protein B